MDFKTEAPDRVMFVAMNAGMQKSPKVYNRSFVCLFVVVISDTASERKPRYLLHSTYHSTKWIALMGFEPHLIFTLPSLSAHYVSTANFRNRMSDSCDCALEKVTSKFH
jgi:hypothetical protein